MVTLLVAIQKYCIFTTEREYAQLIKGIRSRLDRQREQLMAARVEELTHEKE